MIVIWGCWQVIAGLMMVPTSFKAVTLLFFDSCLIRLPLLR